MPQNCEIHREHPLKILKYALKNIWLLIFPIIRGIKSFHPDINLFYNWLKGAWFDVLIIFLILGFGFIRWFCTRISFDENHISISSRFFIESETTVPYSNICVVSLENPFYLTPFGAVRMKIKTRGADLKKADVSLLINNSFAEQLKEKLPDTQTHHGSCFDIRPSFLTIIFFSFIFSSSLSGAVYISSIFFQLGRFSQDLMEHELKNAIEQITNDVSARLALGIPPTAITIGILIIATWLLSFISNILRYAKFSIKKDNSFLIADMGAVTKRHYCIAGEKINYIDINQSLIMKVFGKVSLNISCSGYGRQKSELPVLFPILNKKQIRSALDILGFREKKYSHSVKASRSAVFTYLGVPMWLCFGIPALSLILIYFFPQFSRLIISFAVMAEIPSLWIAIVKIIALLSTGVTFNDNFIRMKYSRFFTFHTVIAHRNKIVKAQIVQNPIQKKFKRCRLDIFFSSELPKKNRLHGMNIDQAVKLLSDLGINTRFNK